MSRRNLPVGRGEMRKLPWSKGPISIGSSCATSRPTAHFSSKPTSGEPIYVSTNPSGWTGRDEEIALVKGANLNRLKLRYVQAYGSFLVKAHLWRTDLCLDEPFRLDGAR